MIVSSLDLSFLASSKNSHTRTNTHTHTHTHTQFRRNTVTKKNSSRAWLIPPFSYKLSEKLSRIQVWSEGSMGVKGKNDECREWRAAFMRSARYEEVSRALPRNGQRATIVQSLIDATGILGMKFLSSGICCFKKMISQLTCGDFWRAFRRV